MNVQIIRSDGCKNCRYASHLAQGDNLECRWGPPTAVPLLRPGPNGSVEIAGNLSIFPLVGPDVICGRHERGVVALPGEYRPTKVEVAQ